MSATGMGAAKAPDPRTLKGAEYRAIAAALEETAWNVSAAAKILACGRSTLHRKMKRLGLDRPVAPR